MMVRQFGLMRGYFILRIVGVAFAIVGALGAVLALVAFFDAGRDLGVLYTFGFSACGAAAGLIAARAKPVKQGSLFWTAALGFVVCAPIRVFQVATLIYAAFVRGQEVHIAWVFLGGPVSDIWWPPKGVGAC